MTQTMSTGSKSTEYLLGKLTEGEQSVIEDRFFVDQTAFNDLLIAENELTDAYVSGRLSKDDSLRYENRLLLTRRQHQRARFAKALVTYAGRHATETVGASSHGRTNWLDLRASILNLRLAVSGAAVLLLVALAGYWFMRLPEQASVQTVSEQRSEQRAITNLSSAPSEGPKTEIAKVSNSNTSPRASSRPRSASIATILLPLGSTRDLSAGSAFVIPHDATRVRLVATIEDGGCASCFARLETVDGRQIWHGHAAGRAGSVSVVIPRDKLKPGDFILTLKTLGLNKTYQDAAQFAFTIK